MTRRFAGALFERSPLAGFLKSTIRAPMQETQAFWSLNTSRALARLRGLQVPTGSDLEAAVRARVAARRVGRPPPARGDLHIFLAYPGVSWAKLLPRSLAPFGRVSEFDYRGAGFDFQTTGEFLRGRDDMDRALLAAFDRAQAERPVDIAVTYLSGTTTDPGVLERIAGAGAVVLNFCWDDKLGWPGGLLGGRYTSTAALAHAVDLNLTNAPDSVIKYALHGGLAMFWPESGLPEVHRPWPASFDYDVSFVGARYGWRPVFIERLKRRGIRVECFGAGWKNGPLTDEDMVRLYSRSRINLGFAGIGNSRRLMCLKGRDFEVPMSGGLYLTQNNPELALVFEVGKEMVTYRDEEDCVRAIRALLSDPDRCETIRAAGRARCLRDHTYELRWSQVFRVVGLMP